MDGGDAYIDLVCYQIKMHETSKKIDANIYGCYAKIVEASKYKRTSIAHELKVLIDKILVGFVSITKD